MARSMWRGAISFGMVAIPVRMYLATEAHSAVAFRQLCPHCQQPIKQLRHCPQDDHVVGYSETLKGYEVAKNQFVIIDEADLDKLPLKTTKTIDIVEFVDREEVPGSEAVAIDLADYGVPVHICDGRTAREVIETLAGAAPARGLGRSISL